MAVKFTAESFKKITLADMAEFIEKNYPDKKAWFKGVAYSDKSGNPTKKYNHLNAVRAFCAEFAPDLLPKKKEQKEPATKRIANW